MVFWLKKYWLFLSNKPAGKWLFSRLLGYLIPYSASIKAEVLEVSPGLAKVKIKEHRSITNHLNSIHAIALINLGELTTGLALHFALEDNDRAILVALTINYLKKARGQIIATAHIGPIADIKPGPIDMLAHLKDETGDDVAVVKVSWLVDKKPRSN